MKKQKMKKQKMKEKENKNCNTESEFEGESSLSKEDLEVTEMVVYDTEQGCRVRAYLLDGTKSRYVKGALKFIVVGWEHPNLDYFDDGGFFYKSPHMRKWEFVPIVNWVKQYKNAYDFLRDYPGFLELFDYKEIHPVMWKITKLLLQKKKFKIVVDESEEQD
jgi:hypothetical protein